MGSSYLLRSVTSEKENRTVEVLLLSVDPRQLMAGKILAMSMVMLIQVVILVTGSLLLISRGGALPSVAGFAFPPGFFLLAILFLVLGYLLFASAMIAAGAIAPNAREAAPMTWLLILPLLPTLMAGSLFAENPQSILTIALSLFPLSAPSAMVTRLAVGPVPTWQVVISLAGLAVTTYLFVLLAARFFQAGNLLSERSFNLKRLLTEWRT
jgi:ABC-2 type transport system permease protein